VRFGGGPLKMSRETPPNETVPASYIPGIEGCTDSSLPICRLQASPRENLSPESIDDPPKMVPYNGVTSMKAKFNDEFRLRKHETFNRSFPRAEVLVE
jgi:hypothetical protein